jgi:hypothetical protein
MTGPHQEPAFDSRDWTDSATPSGPPMTISMVLFGDDPRAAVPKRGWAPLRQKLARIRAEMRPAAERELAAAIAGLLEVDLADTVRHGWCSHSRLIAAAQATVANPGSTEVVALATHRITASHTPHVDLVIDDVKTATVEVTVEVDVEIDGLVGSVHAGRLVSLHNGRCEVRVTLLYGSAELASGAAVLDAPQAVDLGAGLDLLGHDSPAEYADRRW